MKASLVKEGKKQPRNPNLPQNFVTVTKTVKVCKQHGCKFRVKKDSTRVFCFRHDSQYKNKHTARNNFKELSESRLKKIEGLRKNVSNLNRGIVNRNQKIEGLRKNVSNLNRGIVNRNQKIARTKKYFEEFLENNVISFIVNDTKKIPFVLRSDNLNEGDIVERNNDFLNEWYF